MGTPLTVTSWKYNTTSRYLKIFSLYTTNFTELLSYQASAFLKLPEFP